jgi:hypothetical protein
MKPAASDTRDACDAGDGFSHIDAYARACGRSYPNCRHGRHRRHNTGGGLVRISQANRRHRSVRNFSQYQVNVLSWSICKRPGGACNRPASGPSHPLGYHAQNFFDCLMIPGRGHKTVAHEQPFLAVTTPGGFLTSPNARGRTGPGLHSRCHQKPKGGFGVGRGQNPRGPWKADTARCRFIAKP